MSIDSSNASSATVPSASRPGDLPDDHPLRARIAEAVHAVRDTTPLAQSFTNFVTINLVANAQLAVGGTAAMSYLPDDVLDIAAICGATYINVGTLLPFYKDALADIARGLHDQGKPWVLDPVADVLDIAAICGATYINVGTLLPFYKDALADIARGLHDQGKPWVLDPVAAGLGATRTAILESFRDVPPTVVRGNASEIIVLDRMWELSDMTADAGEPTTRPAGVESADEVESAMPAARRIARHLAAHSNDGQGAVAVSGAVDFVTDGTRDYRLPGGSALMTKITGAGCSLGGVVGTYLAVAVAVSGAVDFVTDGTRDYRLPGGSALMTKITGAGCSLGGVVGTYLAVANPLTAAMAASLHFNRAGEIAEAAAHGPGSFQTEFLDALWNVTAEQIAVR